MIHDITTNEDRPVLVNSKCGFTLHYLNNFYNRCFRQGTSFLSEASSIRLSWPHEAAAPGERHLANLISKVFFCYLRLKECCVSFDIDDPFPSKDKQYGVRNEGFPTIFNAFKDDPVIRQEHTKNGRKRKHNVVTDGNQVLARATGPDEMKFKTNNRGRPKAKDQPTPKTVVSKSRCKQVKDTDCVNFAKRRIGGLFCTVTTEKCGGTVFHLGEMLNGERKTHKKEALTCVCRHISIGTYFHDCACQLAGDAQFNKHFDRTLLDAFHAKKHKCSKREFDLQHKMNKRFGAYQNTQAAEQLWSKMDKFVTFAAKLRRSHYRAFWKHYCLWRNHYNRSGLTSDINPSRSFKSRMLSNRR